MDGPVMFVIKPSSTVNQLYLRSYVELWSIVISTIFKEQIFADCRTPKKYKQKTVSKEKQLKTILYVKAARKMLMKLTPGPIKIIKDKTLM